MLNVNPETVVHLMDLAREFHSQDGSMAPEAEIDSGHHCGGDLLASLLERHGEDAILQEFRVTVADLEPDQQQQVVALYWLGRDDFTPGEWLLALDEARRSWNERTAEYLISHPHLADHLREGLERLGYEGE